MADLGTPAPGWHVERSAGTAAALHDRPLPDPPRPTVWVHAVTGPALVLGSTQRHDLVDLDAAGRDGVEVCRRRSGGGLVALEPGNGCWIDVVVPRWSPLWDDDVGRSFSWIGAAWAAALKRVLGTDWVSPRVHRGRPTRAGAGRVICFAGLGPGEVTVGGHKVVGMSQRRTTSAARFQCAMVSRWHPRALASYIDADALRHAGIELGGLAVGLPPGVRDPGPDRVVSALLSALPHPGAAPDSRPSGPSSQVTAT